MAMKEDSDVQTTSFCESGVKLSTVAPTDELTTAGIESSKTAANPFTLATFTSPEGLRNGLAGGTNRMGGGDLQRRLT